jgi:SAM-dependent methyltransferase
MYNTEHADNLWSFEAKRNPREIIITGTGDNEELYEQSALEQINIMQKWKLFNKNSITLHIGCGNGRIEKYLALLVKQCYGVDVSSEMIALAKERCISLDNVEFFKGSGFDLSDLEDNSTNFAYSFFVFQHMPRQCASNYFMELGRVLKPKGKFLCQFQLFGDEAAVSGEYNEPEEDHPSDIRLYSVEQINKLAEIGGFEIFDYKERIQAELDSKRRVWDCNIFPIFKKL